MPNGVIEQRAVAGAATHAIVIGVGAYAHLPGGGGPLVQDPEGMAQLTSPPISARKFATWLIQRYNVPDRPLATVALLVSEARPKPFIHPVSGASIPLEDATIANLKAALEAWRARGDAMPDQRLIFYFCGHGIGKGTDTALLAADYGVSPLDPLDAAIDFRNFLLGMAQSVASEQVYFIDACRAHSGGLLNAGGYNGRPIFRPNLAANSNPNLRAPVFYAALAGQRAFSYERKPSLFTAALIDGLDGRGANDDEGDWRVTAYGLKASLDFDLAPALRRLGSASVPATDNSVPIDLQHLPAGQVPKGTAILECDPSFATPAAHFSYELGGVVTPRERNRLGTWRVPLDAASYKFRADFPRGKWRAPTPEEVWIRPVFRRVKVKAV